MGGSAGSSQATCLDPSLYRQVLGHLPTGVTVVAAHGLGGPVGMAANSVTSVSLDPPLILVCPSKTSETWPAVRASGRFCVNVMAAHHEALCRRFAAKGADRFAEVGWHERAAGPGLDEALAWIDCSLREEHDAGDHLIAVADVLAIDARASSPPLVFFRGCYGTFAPRPALSPAGAGR
jgi:3-hydroxy-9,10-secoandrosta-1,3,5(10)-triene-9,17-dione monooxygenase reductase component